MMIACLSPSDTNYEETMSTLKYAHNTKNIRNRPGMNCIKIGLPGKLILSKRKGLWEVLFS